MLFYQNIVAILFQRYAFSVVNIENMKCFENVISCVEQINAESIILCT